MPRLTTCGLASLTDVLALVGLVRGDAIPWPTGPTKIAPADAIVVGQVVGFEDQDLQAKVAPNATGKLTYRVAILQVTETLKGDAKQKAVRVGFIPPANAGGPNPPVKYNLQLTLGQ